MDRETAERVLPGLADEIVNAIGAGEDYVILVRDSEDPTGVHVITNMDRDESIDFIEMALADMDGGEECWEDDDGDRECYQPSEN